MADGLIKAMEHYRTFVLNETSLTSLAFTKKPAQDDNPPSGATTLPRGIYYLGGDSREVAKTCTRTVFEVVIVFRLWHNTIELAGATVSEHNDAITDETKPLWTDNTVVTEVERRLDGGNYTRKDGDMSYGEQRIVLRYSQNRTK